METSNIRAFLKYNEKSIDKDWILIPLIANIAILCVGFYLSQNKVIGGIISAIFSIVMVFLYFYACRKINFDKEGYYIKEKNLSIGIAMCCLSFSCAFLSFQIINKYWFHPILLAFIFVLSYIVFSVCIVWYFIFGTNNGRYVKKTKPKSILIGVSSSIIAFSVLLSSSLNKRLSQNSTNLISGIIINLIGIIFLYGLVYVLKYYYYCKLEKYEIKTENGFLE